MVREASDRGFAPTGGAQPALRVVLCGEVSSGKTTVMNALLRRKLIPTAGVGDQRPRVIVAHRKAPGRDVILSDGNVAPSQPDDAPHAAPLPPGTQKVVYWTDQSHLEGIELTEIPLTTADALTEADRETIAAADVMIWLTIGSQAWRFTEKTIVDALGARRPPLNLLAVSRTDKLRSESDRAKLRDRLYRETSDYFDEIHFMRGAGRTIEMSDESDQTWLATGARSIFETLRAARKDMGKRFSEPTASRETQVTAEIFDLDAMRAQNVAAPHPEAVPQSRPQEADVPPTPRNDAVLPGSPNDAAAELSDGPLILRSKARTSDTPIDPSLREALRTVASETPGIALACFWVEDAADAPIASMVGDEPACRAARVQCREALVHLSNAYVGAGLDGTPEAVSIATASRRICILPVHGGTLFFIADASRLSEGRAQTALRRFASEAVALHA